MKVIVLKITNYKEKDGIIDVISENEKMSFLARSIFDPKSKTASLNNVLTVADIELSDGNYKYPFIKSNKVITTPINPHSDLKYMSVIMGMVEIINVLLNEEEQIKMYSHLLQTINYLKEGRDPYSLFLIFLAKALSISGYDFEVNSCINCGSKKDIVSFSFEDGGFLCRNCCPDDAPRYFSKEQMLFIRYSFLNKDLNLPIEEINNDDAIVIIHKFFEFIYDSFGVKLKSNDLIK